MDRRGRWLLAVLVLLGVGEIGWIAWQTRAPVAEAEHAPPALSQKAGPVFSSREVSAFLAVVKRAEAIKDPLKRCLAYPDPPRSHWSHAVVSAYCQYRTQAMIPFAEVQALIQNGHAADLDRRMARALQDQRARAGSIGLLDQIYYRDFDDASPDVRATLDAWKRNSPSSAFAYAASGFAYVAMAESARGDDYIRNTPSDHLVAMDRLLSEADADLQQAIKLNPQVTPAYVAIINAGRMGGSRAYINEVARRALAVAPADFSIYAALMGAKQEKWGGSLDAMGRLARHAQAQVAENPLLVLLLAEEPASRYDACGCESRTVWAADPKVFDNVANLNLLMQAGFAGGRHGHTGVGFVYISEALRFAPDNVDARVNRNYYLTDFGDLAWALADANRIISTWPQKPGGFEARAYAYESIKDYPHAEQDLNTAISRDPSEMWPLIELGDIYGYKTHDWDKGWDIANRVIQLHPEKPQGWILRASIQKDQPRAGMDDTVHYFLAHFGNDPHLQLQVREMRAALAKEAASTRQATPVPPPHAR